MKPANSNRDASLLAVRIRAELADIGQVVERSQYLMAKATQRNDNDYYDGKDLGQFCAFLEALEEAE